MRIVPTNLHDRMIVAQFVIFQIWKRVSPTRTLVPFPVGVSLRKRRERSFGVTAFFDTSFCVSQIVRRIHKLAKLRHRDFRFADIKRLPNNSQMLPLASASLRLILRRTHSKLARRNENESNSTLTMYEAVGQSLLRF